MGGGVMHPPSPEQSTDYASGWETFSFSDNIIGRPLIARLEIDFTGIEQKRYFSNHACRRGTLIYVQKSFNIPSGIIKFLMEHW